LESAPPAMPPPPPREEYRPDPPDAFSPKNTFNEPVPDAAQDVSMHEPDEEPADPVEELMGQQELREMERVKAQLEQELQQEREEAANRERELQMLRDTSRGEHSTRTPAQIGGPQVDPRQERRQKLEAASGMWWLQREDFHVKRAWKFLLCGELHQVAVAHCKFNWQVACDNDIVREFSHGTSMFTREQGAGTFQITTVEGQVFDASLKVSWNLMSGKWDIRLKVNHLVVPPCWAYELDKEKKWEVDPPEVAPAHVR